MSMPQQMSDCGCMVAYSAVIIGYLPLIGIM
jgi:hypothetical protein